MGDEQAVGDSHFFLSTNYPQAINHLEGIGVDCWIFYYYEHRYK